MSKKTTKAPIFVNDEVFHNVPNRKGLIFKVLDLGKTNGLALVEHTPTDNTGTIRDVVPVSQLVFHAGPKAV